VETDAATAALRGAGLRVTAPRLAVLGALGNHAHLTVDTIATSVRERLGAVSTQAVYDNLEVLLVAGLVRRIEPAGSPARFELRVGDNHHHLVCRGCGLVVDTDCAVVDPPCLTPSDDNGFAIDEAEVIYWGRCPGCSTAISSEHTL
jgi:Fur family transcriptional regulator, stress-responsive regulator